MQLTNSEVIPIECERFGIDGGAMFGIIPKNLWQKEHPADEANRVALRTSVLLIKTAERNILIDTGIGNKLDNKLRQRFRVDENSDGIIKGLERAGLQPGDITDVILTHLHFDHTGGSTYQDNGELRITFANAVHYVQAEHWDYACQSSIKDRASFLMENFKILEDQNKLKKLDGIVQLFPGIEIFIAHGHTRAMQLVRITDGDTTIVHGADLIPTASHIPITWNMAYDNQPLLTIEEKSKLLQQISENKWILFFEHDPKYFAGTVNSNEKGFKLDREIRL